MRPRYHYAPRANWLSDPNGLVHQAGEWHMAYQDNPDGEDWGHMAWGHAVSPDLAHWTELPPALVEEAGVMVYSGGAVIDHGNTAGFGADAMVAIWTGADHAANRQAQCLAYSTDKGRHWTKYAGNPVLDEGMADFRDPCVFWHEPTARWIMVVVRSTENRAAIYASPDLKAWTWLSFIATDGAPGHLWECPLLIELPVESSDQRRWLFKVDVLSGAPGSGAMYRTGHFDGTHFVPEGPWHVADHGHDFYAAIAWEAPRDDAGRPTWIGWMGNHAVQKHLPKQGWRGAMSLPRRIGLRRGEGGYRLCQAVEPAVLARFGAETALKLGPEPVSLPAAAILTIAGDIALAIEDAAGRHCEISRTGDQVRVMRRDPVTPQLDAVATMTAPGLLTVLIDTGSIECLADSGAAALTLQHRLAGETWRIGADRAAVVHCRELSTI